MKKIFFVIFLPLLPWFIWAAPPSISLTTVWEDTTYTGPYLIKSVIRCNDPINSYLWYHFNESGDNWVSPDSSKGDTFFFSLPQVPDNNLERPVWVYYRIYSYNINTWEESYDPTDRYFFFINEIYNPRFHYVTALRDTFYSGPYIITATITAGSAIDAAELTYDNVQGSNTLPYDSLKGDTFYFSIPRQGGSSQTPINYLWYLYAHEATNNNWSYYPAHRESLNHFQLRDPWASDTRSLSHTGSVGPFPVWSRLRAEGTIVNDSLWIYNQTLGDWEAFARDSVASSDPEVYYYTIPQQQQPVVNPVSVNWFIKAYDGLTGNYVVESDTIFKFNIYDWEPPQVSGLTRLANSMSNGPFEVYADIWDTSGITQARLYYRSRPASDTSWYYLPMYSTGIPRRYRGIIPAQAYGTLVQYFVRARDGASDGFNLIGNLGYCPEHTVETPYQFFAGQNPERILLVNDALVTDNFMPYYMGSLDTIVTTYAYWDHRRESVLPWLSNFNMLIWFTGNDSLNTLVQEERDSLVSFLERGGNLLLVSKNFGQNFGDTTVLFRDYLRSTYLSANAGQVVLLGRQAYPISQIGDSLTVGSVNNKSMDRISPLAGADSVFSYRLVGGAGVVRCSTNVYKAVFSCVPVEALQSISIQRISRTRFLARCLKWFGANVFYKVEGEPEPEANLLEAYLSPALPNPMREKVRLSFYIPRPSWVNFKIYNVNGQLVKIIYEGQSEAGRSEFHWDGRDDQGRQVSNGIYFYKLEAGDIRLTNKLVILQ